MNSPLVKDPGDLTNYRLDLSNVLETGETIASVDSLVVPSPLVEDTGQRLVGSSYIDIWLSGGVAFTSYLITAEITTSGGRVYNRSLILTVEEM